MARTGDLMADSDDTMQADSGDESETVVVDSHTISVDRAELAWSQDEPETETQRRSWRAVSVIAAAVMVSGATAAAVVLWLTTTDSTRNQPTQPTHVAPPTVSAAPAPSATTTTAAPPASTPSVLAEPTGPVVLTSQDQILLREMQRYGLSIPTGNAAKYAIERGHLTCAYRATHTSPDTVAYVQRTTIWTDEESAIAVMSASETAYCPQFGNS
jgi:hypothetical protein